jgi:hypothetical protein
MTLTPSGTAGALSVVAAGILNLLAVQGQTTLPIVVVPAINLTAIILGSIAMGSMFNRVKQLERRVDKIQRRVFREREDEWDRVTERRIRPTRGEP